MSILELVPESVVRCGEEHFVVLRPLEDFVSVLARSLQSGKIRTLRVGDLGPARPETVEEPSAPKPDLMEIPAEDWAVATRRLEVIRPFVGYRRVPRAEVERRSAESAVGVTTIYRWLRATVPAVSSPHCSPLRGVLPPGAAYLIPP